MFTLGIQFQDPSPLPSYYIKRSELLHEIAEKVLSVSTKSDNIIHVTVNIQGMAGFGKSTLAIALCYEPCIQKYFTDGFYKISLGPKSRNKYFLLSEAYHSLTGNRLTEANKITEDEKIILLAEKLNKLCRKNSKLLVIIDDVWKVSDAEYYARIFSGCKVVMTTRRKDVKASIACKHEVIVDSMALYEAFQLLTCEIKELQDADSVTSNKLDELAKNLLKWPLLLCLVRQQLYVACENTLEPLVAIENVTKKLFDNGLTAFDPKNPMKEYAANASIKASLDLLSKDNLYRINKLVKTFTFRDVATKSMLLSIWEIENKEVDESCQVLWSAGLISYTSKAFLFAEIHCIEVHAVISQYLFDHFKVDNMVKLIIDFLIDSQINMKQVDELWKLAEKKLTNDFKAYSIFFIDIFDAQFIPFMIKSWPLLLQAFNNFIAKLFQHVASHEQILHFQIPKTYLKTRISYEQVVSHLNDGETKQALDCLNKANDAFATWLKNLLNIPYISHEMPFIVHYQEMSSFSESYVNFRSILKGFANEKTCTKDRFYNLISGYNQKCNETIMPLLHELNNSQIFQQILIEVPDLQNVLQPIIDILSLLQSTGTKLSITEYFGMVQTYVSQHQNILTDATCCIL